MADGKELLSDDAVQKSTAEDEMKRHRLFGAYQHTVDPKGRVIIPQFFREVLGDRIVLGVNTATDTLVLYNEEVWWERLKMLRKAVQKNRRMEAVLTRFSKLSYPNCSYDQQGRILIPQMLRDLFLKEEKNVQVAGAFDHVTIITESQAKAEEERFAELDVLSMLSEIQLDEEE